MGPRASKLARLLLLFVVVFFIALLIAFRSLEDHESNSGEAIGRKIFKKFAPGNAIKFVPLGENVFAVSAFADQRNGNMGYPFVRVVIITYGIIDFECKIGGKTSPESNLYELSENHAMLMRTFVLNCKLPHGVSFAEVDHLEVRTVGTNSFTRINITYRIPDEKHMQDYKVDLSICVPSLFGRVYDAQRIIEFAELNALMGVQKIFVYTSMLLDENLKQTFEYYSENNLIELIDYQLPFGDEVIWYHAQLVLVTDCLLRNVGFAKFTSFNDIDEFFVPTKDESLLKVIRRLFTHKMGSLRVSTQYMPMGGPVTLSNTDTEKYPIYEHRLTKCIVRPEMVFEQGIHHTSRVIQDDYTTPSHKGEELRVLHYKRSSRLGCCKVDDSIPRRFGQTLRKQIDFVASYLSTE